MQSPVPALVSIRTPSGLQSSVSTTRSATLSDPQNLLSHSQLQETVVRNGATYLSTYTASSRTRVDTTPLGRTSTLQMRPDGKPLIANRSGLAAASFAYDARGRLDFATVGTGDDARVTDPEYFATGPHAGRLM